MAIFFGLVPRKPTALSTLWPVVANIGGIWNAVRAAIFISLFLATHTRNIRPRGLTLLPTTEAQWFLFRGAEIISAVIRIGSEFPKWPAFWCDPVTVCFWSTSRPAIAGLAR